MQLMSTFVVFKIYANKKLLEKHTQKTNQSLGPARVQFRLCPHTYMDFFSFLLLLFFLKYRYTALV